MILAFCMYSTRHGVPAHRNHRMPVPNAKKKPGKTISMHDVRHEESLDATLKSVTQRCEGVSSH